MASRDRRDSGVPPTYLFGGGLAVLALASLVAAVVFVLTGGLQRVTTGSPATLSLLRGTATVRPAGQGADWATVDGQTVRVGDRVRTAPESNVLLTFSDGSTVELEPGTELAVEAIGGQPERPVGIVLRQAAGTTWARVVALTDASSRFEIATPGAVAAVRGTLFEVAVLPSSAGGPPATRVRTVEGAVAVAAAGREVLVGGGQEATTVHGQPPANPAPIPPAAGVLTLTLEGPGRLLAVDPIGRAVGLGPGGLPVSQIPGATTTAAAASPQVVALPDPLAGGYSLALAAEAAGTYRLSVHGRSPGQPGWDLRKEGALRPGQTAAVELRVAADGGRVGGGSLSDAAVARPAKIVVPKAAAPVAARATPESRLAESPLQASSNAPGPPAPAVNPSTSPTTSPPAPVSPTAPPRAPAPTAAGPPPSGSNERRTVWIRGFPQAGPDGCVYYVAEWSDGTFTATPWDCAGGAARRGELTATGGYPQLTAGGCVEYVTRWSDGSYTWVPFACPAGVAYPKAE